MVDYGAGGCCALPFVFEICGDVEVSVELGIVPLLGRK